MSPSKNYSSSGAKTRGWAKQGRHAAGLLQTVDAAHLLLGIPGCLLLRPFLLLLFLSLGLGLSPQPGNEEERSKQASHQMGTFVTAGGKRTV